MVFSLALPKRDRDLLLILAVVYLIARVPFLTFLPLIQDEAIYSLVIIEQAHSPSLVPTLFGYPVSWKPPLFFWTYSLFSWLPLPIEAALRLPSLLFGLASLVPLYFLLVKAGGSRNLAFFSLLIFIFSMPTLYAQAGVLTDSLAFLLIACSLYFYCCRKPSDSSFLAAGALAFAAFMTKHVLAAMIPVLALLYLYIYDRKSLTRPSFLLSMLAVPAAFAVHLLLIQGAGLGAELYGSEMLLHFGSGKLTEGLGNTIGSLNIFFNGAGVWFALSLFGLWKHWKSNLFMACWYCLIVFPIISGYFMPWYYLPVMPAVAYFAALVLLKWDGKERPDALFTIFLALALVLTAAVIVFTYTGMAETYLPQKEAGLLLAGKENVLIIGTYMPGIPAYKVLAEEKSLGRQLDFGWVVATENFTARDSAPFISDYNVAGQQVVEGSFSGIFTTSDTFRKNSNITAPDYVAAVGSSLAAGSNLTVAGGEIIYNKANITIYKINKNR